MELFLTKLFGLYFLIAGVIMLIRRTSVVPALREFAAHSGIHFILGAIELVAGLALVIAYPTVSLDVPGAFSLIGYMMIIESLIYLALPVKTVQRVIRAFSRPVWFISGGVIAVAVGVYLTGIGFGYF